MKISEAFAQMESGGIVVCDIPDRYDLVLRIRDGRWLEESVAGCWYPCRKGVTTLMRGTWRIYSVCVDPIKPPASIEDRLERIEERLFGDD